MISLTRRLFWNLCKRHGQPSRSKSRMCRHWTFRLSTTAATVDRVHTHRLWIHPCAPGIHSFCTRFRSDGPDGIYCTEPYLRAAHRTSQHAPHEATRRLSCICISIAGRVRIQMMPQSAASPAEPEHYSTTHSTAASRRDGFSTKCSIRIPVRRMVCIAAGGADAR